jgi:hypothetical protein
MNKDELRQLMPRNKDDEERAQYIISLGYDNLKPVINDMVRWLRAADSPVAKIFIKFFSENGPLAVDDVHQVLRTTKLSILKYVIVTRVLPNWPRQAIENLEGSLTGLVTDSGEPETALMSLDLLAKHNLGKKDWLKSWLEFITERMERNAKEAKKIKDRYFQGMK